MNQIEVPSFDSKLHMKRLYPQKFRLGLCSFALSFRNACLVVAFPLRFHWRICSLATSCAHVFQGGSPYLIASLCPREARSRPGYNQKHHPVCTSYQYQRMRPSLTLHQIGLLHRRYLQPNNVLWYSSPLWSSSTSPQQH